MYVGMFGWTGNGMGSGLLVARVAVQTPITVLLVLSSVIQDEEKATII